MCYTNLIKGKIYLYIIFTFSFLFSFFHGKSMHFILEGSMSPNFLAKQKVPGTQRLAKNLLFNFTNHPTLWQKFSKTLCWICELKYGYRLTNLSAICQMLSVKKTFSSCWEKNSRQLGLVHTRHFGTQYWDKKIKRYCDKKIVLSHGFQWLAKVSS